MTYQIKSTIYAPSAHIINWDTDKVSLDTKNMIGYSHQSWTKHPDQNFYKAKRTDLVAWWVSDCNEVRTHREDYVSYLENYIKVDIYGSCGNLECTPDKGETCTQYLAKKYKFVLAFEADLCTDYATYKWFSVMDQPTTVAVVMGGANYAALAPPMSFINVADFRSAKELANYLLYLDSHDDEYIKYFAWKYEWRVDYRNPVCKVCELLHDQKQPPNTVDLDEVGKTSGCKTGADQPWLIQSQADEIEERAIKKEENLHKEQELAQRRMQEKSQRIAEKELKEEKKSEKN